MAGASNPDLADLVREISELRQEVSELRKGLTSRDKELAELRKGLTSRDKELAELREQNARLTKALEASRRSGKRQSAPFSKRPPKKDPKKPGRKKGEDYGKKERRKLPDKVDEILEAPLPCRCPKCGGAVVEEDVVEQFHTEVPPVEPVVTQFNIHVGACQDCGQSVQGRHPQQTSDAIGAAASQIGPRAVALASQLQKDLGLSYGKVQRVFREVFNLEVSRGGLAQAIYRVASRVEPTYEAMRVALPKAPVITPDETGWRVGGWSAWLWAFDAENFVVYGILPGRSFDDATEILSDAYDGRLVRDGWAPYRSYEHALHQTCLNHLIVRCSELLQTAVAGAARVPNAVKRLLQGALLLRDRRDAEHLTEHGFRSLRGKLIKETEALLSWSPTNDDNRRLLKHLKNEHDIGALFRFLFEPGLPATNHRAEQAIRPAVVNRKVWGGNRTWNGAHTQEVLTTFFTTARRQTVDAIASIVDLLRCPDPQVIPFRGIDPPIIVDV